MRKVMVSELSWSPEAKRNVKKEKGEALFHQFGIDYEEFETAGPAQFTSAIIEWPDGQVESVGVPFIRFLDNP